MYDSRAFSYTCSVGLIVLHAIARSWPVQKFVIFGWINKVLGFGFLITAVASEKSVGRTIAWSMLIVIEGSFSSLFESRISTVGKDVNIFE